MHERPLPNLTSANRDVPLPSRSTWLAVTATLIVGVCAAGCGSSSNSSTSTSTAVVTKPAFLAKANAVCTRGNARTTAVGAKLGKSPTLAQIGAAVKSTYVPSIQSQIDGIRALSAPSGDQATVANMLNLAQADLNKLKRKPALLASGPPFADFAKLAHSYGLTACAPSS